MNPRKAVACRYCRLPSLPSMTPGHCKYHWAGQLQKPVGVIGPYVPTDMQEAHRQALRALGAA